MQRQQRVLQLSDRGDYEWGIPSGEVSNADKQQAAIRLTEKMLGALLQQTNQEAFVHAVQGVPVKSLPLLRQRGTPFSPVSTCNLTCCVHSVRFPGKTGLGGGRYVFSDPATQMAKRGPGQVVSVTKIEVCAPVQLGKIMDLAERTQRCSPHCILQSAAQMQTNSAVSLQSPLLSPITLELHMQWNRFYRTLQLATPGPGELYVAGVDATPAPGELYVAGLDQVQKATGSGHDTWLYYAGLSQDFGNDCLVKVSRLHPTLNGAQQVDKARDQQLTIRAPLYSDIQRQEIDNAIAHNTPTVQKLRQASQSKILHELTVQYYSAKDHLGNDIPPTTLEEILQSAGASAASAASSSLHPISALSPQSQWQQPRPTVEALQQIPILPSTLVGSISPTHQRAGSDCGLSATSEVTCTATVVV